MKKVGDHNLDKQLKEIQSLLADSDEKVLGELGHYLHFLSPFGAKRDAPHAVSNGSIKTLKEGGITWIDIENPTRREINQLMEEYPFHSLHLEDSLLNAQLPIFEKEDEYIFLLLNIPNVNGGEKKVITDQIGIFVGKNYLITVHSSHTPESRQLFDECENNPLQRSAYFKHSSGYLLYVVIERYLRDLFVVVEEITIELDEIEDLVFDARNSDGFRIGQLRQKIIRLKRTIGPLKNVLDDLAGNVNEFTGENLSRYYRNISKMITRLAELIEESRETIEVYKDADFTGSTAKTNKILAMLTIIFTLTIPATVIGTFFGMNIPLPGGSEVGAWQFFGTYTTFLVLLVFSLVPAFILFRYFRRKGWF